MQWDDINFHIFISCSRSDGKPEKPPSSGYSLFVKHQLSKRKGDPKGKAIKEVGSLWNKLKDEEKALYKHTCTKVRLIKEN